MKMIDYDLFQQAFKDVKRINALDPANEKMRLCKVYEEMGELTQAINKTLGRKVVKETPEEVLANIKEEIADTVQCLYSWWDTSDRDAHKEIEKLLNRIEIPIRHNEDRADLLLAVYAHVADPGTILGLSSMSYIMKDMIMLAQCFDFSFDDINKEVLVKNKKWEKVVAERKAEKSISIWPFN